jgi:hypothetical protein
VAAAARRQRRATGRRAPDAGGGPVRSPGTGIFLILAAKAPASVRKMNRPREAITSLGKKTGYVYRYSFHIMDPAGGTW